MQDRFLLLWLLLDAPSCHLSAVMITLYCSIPLTVGAVFLGQNNGVSPVADHLLEPVASSHLVGVAPRRLELPPRVVLSGWRRDLAPY